LCLYIIFSRRSCLRIYSVTRDFLEFEREREGGGRMRLKLLEGPLSVAKQELHVYINNVYKLSTKITNLLTKYWQDEFSRINGLSD